jgi:hypothetical protein
MTLNKYVPHVYIIPEDRADAELANGFVNHDQVIDKQIKVLPCADGWSGVLEKFETQYIRYLQDHKNGHVILLIDFDSDYDSRRQKLDIAVPQDLKDRVFVIGSKDTPEQLKQNLAKSLEQIGESLAEDCYQDTCNFWGHEQLKHNEPDRLRLMKTVRSILFHN